MRHTDDVDSPDYRDTNVGEGFVETAAERQERLRVERMERELDRLRAIEAKAGELARYVVAHAEFITPKDDFGTRYPHISAVARELQALIGKGE